MVVLSRLVMMTIFLSLCFRWALQALPYQFLNPPLFNLNLEIPYRIYMYFHLNVLVTSSVVSIIFSFSLLIACVLCFLFPRKNWLFIIFSILYLLYYITFNNYIVHHEHPMSLMVWITVPFWAKRRENKMLLWEGVRLYVIFIYVVSFILKVEGGSPFVWNNGLNTVKWNYAAFLYYFPDSITASVITYFIAHPFVINLGHFLIIMLEGVMAIGFFTKKYDRWIMWIPILLHVSTYLFSDVFFIEMFVLVFLFLNDKQIGRIYRKMPFLAK